MIPFDYITEWRGVAPWAMEAQIEQDLILSRAVVSMFAESEVTNLLAFRGGTALYKLHLRTAARYSENIDLVQVRAGQIGAVLDAIRRALDPWLGPPRRATHHLERARRPPVPPELRGAASGPDAAEWKPGTLTGFCLAFLFLMVFSAPSL